MAAQAAEQAGADFILALGAGKMRSMGVASPASLLPVYDGVNFTIDFAISELLPRTELPVYVGLPLFDPRLDCSALIERLKKLDIKGLTNFPAVFHFGERAETLENFGFGQGREIAFLTEASNAGLETIGYVRSRADATAMVNAGISTLCINFGLNPTTRRDEIGAEKADQIAIAAKDIVEHVRKPRRKLTIFLGGGPVSGGANLDRLCRKAEIDGFIGGSALDRVPLERSLVNSVASFREIEVLQNRLKRVQRKMHGFSDRYGIICQSFAMGEMLDRAEKLIMTGSHIAISGEENTGRIDVARMIASRIQGSRRQESWELVLTGEADSAPQLFGRPKCYRRRRLVGMLELSNARRPIILCGIPCLPPELQDMLAEFVSEGSFRSVGNPTVKHSDARVIFILDAAAETSARSGTLTDSLAAVLKGREVSVPPLRDRIEDIPELARKSVEGLGVDGERLTTPIIRTLVRHGWPGNLKELDAVIRWLVKDRNFRVSETELIAHLGSHQQAASGLSSISRRDRIIQALLLNNLNRTRTAEYLGVSRKTLYNQIRKYDILS